MIYVLIAVVAVMALLVPCGAAPATAPQFGNGDVVAIIGDSITHGRKYHRYVYEYYLTRFPERQVRFVNQGIAGDSAGGGLFRLQWDILPWHPNAASIMFGMNDIGRGYYGKANPDQATLDRRRSALDNYRSNMDRLAAGLQDSGCRKLVFVTPSPYDDTADLPLENLFGCNAALAQCGEYGKELAAKYQAGLVDLNGPMTALNLEKQKADPKYTLIGPDRVHPGDLGMLVMAYYYLRAQGVPALVSKIAIADAKVAEAANATVTDLRQDAGGVNFDCLQKALPWPIEASAKEALSLVPLEADLDQELLQVALPDGEYVLAIDGTEVGRYSAEALRAGVNLALNDKTPQYQQALNVVNTNTKRFNTEVKLRTYAQIRLMVLRAKVNEDDPAALEAYFTDFLAKCGESMRPYFTGQINVYKATRPVLEDIKQQVGVLQQELWKLNQPVPHHYQLAKR